MISVGGGAVVRGAWCVSGVVRIAYCESAGPSDGIDKVGDKVPELIRVPAGIVYVRVLIVSWD
jgi:hypothetical protein